MASKGQVAKELDANAAVLARATGRGRLLRQTATPVVIIIASGAWCCAFACTGVGREGLPWYVTIATIACGAAVGANISTRVPAYLVGDRAPVETRETFAASYLMAAIFICVVSFVHTHLLPPQPTKQVQIVDIELTSFEDAADRKSPLPGTVVQEEQKRTRSDQITSQGSLESHEPPRKDQHEQAMARPAEAAPLSRQKANPEKGAGKARQPVENDHQSRAEDETINQHREAVQPDNQALAAVSRQTQSSPPAQVRPASRPSQLQTGEAFMEEVAPPELVEVVENEGVATNTSTFVAGGASSGGKGAGNDLYRYLKDLHRRIKSNWQPPRGQDRRAEILFRIRKSGQLAFVKVVRTSGDSETDAASLTAVANACRNMPLPQGYKHDYLDVQYTFNYRVDELTEVTVGSPR